MRKPARGRGLFFTGIAQANSTLTLGFDGGASVKGGDGFDLLGTGEASFQFVLDFGDRDGDGLLDAWEEEGIDFDGMAPPDIDRPAHEPLAHTGSGLPPEFYLIKDTYFGSDEDAGHPNWDQIREAKLRIFR